MEAMVVHSDNTATDMVLKETGADAVRRFIASIGLKKTMIPDSTRILQRTWPDFRITRRSPGMN